MTLTQGLYAARSHIAVFVGILLAWGAVLAFGPTRRVAQPDACDCTCAPEVKR